MDKTIEAEFFKPFELGETVGICISILSSYDPDLSTDHVMYDEFGVKLDERPTPYTTQEARDLWYKIACIVVFEETEKYNFDILGGQHNPLMEEIDKNLQECTTNKKRERYLFSLLKPFKGLSDVFIPISALKRLDDQIKEADILYRQNGGSQAELNELVQKYEDEKKQILHTQEFFMNMIQQYSIPEKSIEVCLRRFVAIKDVFADMLDALLLENGIDLMKLQKESGIYLKSDRDIEEVARYVGSVELTQKYIDELPEVDMIDQQAQRGDSLNEFNGDTRKIKQAKGRPRSTFRDKILHTNKDYILKELHELISGRKGREVALIIRVCIKEGIITKPTFKQVEDEFGYIGNVSGYNKYMADKYEFNDEEINGIKKKLM